jgi:MFS family permease
MNGGPSGVAPDPAPSSVAAAPPEHAPPASPGRSLPLHAVRPAVPPKPSDTSGFRSVLRQRDFRLLWAAQAASQLADKFLMFTLLIVVYDLSGHATAESLLMVAYTLPSVLLSAPAGVYADRHDKRMLMLATNVVRAGLILLIPLAHATPGFSDRTWPLICVTLLFSSVGQIFAPAEAASIPLMVRRDQIMVATSLFMTTVILTLVLGVPLATLSIRLYGKLTPFFIATGLFAVAAVCVWRIHTNLKVEVGADAPERHLGRELREGLIVLRDSEPLRLALAQLTLALVVVFTIFTLGAVYMRTVLGRTSEDTYLVLIPATVGMVGAAIYLGQAGRRISRATVLIGGLAVAGACLIAIGVLPGPLKQAGLQSGLVPVVVVLAGLFGTALGGLLIPAFTVLQEGTTEETRGRIFGGIFTVINAAVAIPLLLAGGVAELFGVQWVMGGMGVILMVLAAAAMAGRHRLAVLDSVSESHPVAAGVLASQNGHHQP